MTKIGTIGSHIPDKWKAPIAEMVPLETFEALTAYLYHDNQNHTIYPNFGQIYRSLELCDYDDIRVVIIGQDPYHGTGQANGLSFSVNRGLVLPPSLRNIYKEINTDIGPLQPDHGDLTAWAQQGVLMLNTTLTVRAGDPMSHTGRGWEDVTDAIIRIVSQEKEHVVFFLWGRHAQTKLPLIDDQKHLILTAPHPSPFSAHKGFLGCKHFSQANTYLTEHNKKEIDWLKLDQELHNEG